MRRLIVLVVSLALVAAAIAASSAGAARKTKHVDVADDFFQPTRLNIKKGTTVVWTWTGVHPHNVAVESGPSSFHSKVKSSGTYTRTFNRTGTWHLICTIHGMLMSVKVS